MSMTWLFCTGLPAIVCCCSCWSKLSICVHVWKQLYDKSTHLIQPSSLNVSWSTAHSFLFALFQIRNLALHCCATVFELSFVLLFLSTTFLFWTMDTAAKLFILGWRNWSFSWQTFRLTDDWIFKMSTSWFNLVCTQVTREQEISTAFGTWT